MSRFLLLFLTACDGFLFSGKLDAADWVDDDGDGYPQSMDCDDQDPSAYPEAEELCDELDNNCDGEVDEGLISTYYVDEDYDGFGVDESAFDSCNVGGEGLATQGGDCDDDDDSINPGAVEVCDNVDNDCSGGIDDDASDGGWFAEDNDGDGLGAWGGLTWACDGISNDWDCDDNDAFEPQVASPSSTASSPDGSVYAPWPSLQTAIDYATTCVIALPGTYDEAIDLRGKGIAVLGILGAISTTIDATGTAGPAITLASGEGPDTEISGFTVTGGTGQLTTEAQVTNCYSNFDCTSTYNTFCGGGVYVNGASPSLGDLIIRGNTLPAASVVTTGYDVTYTYSFGGGLCAIDTRLDLTGVDISNNSSDQGGGLYIGDGASVVWTQSTLYGNTANDGAGVQVSGGTLVASNLIIAWNTATNAGGALDLLEGSADLQHMTIAGNSATDGGGLYVSGQSTLTLLNSIVVMSDSGYGISGETGATTEISYSNLWGNLSAETNGLAEDPLTSGDGNLSMDPSFVDVSDDGDALNDDWTLSALSPLVEMGDPDSAYNDPDGSRAQMGAYGGPNGAW